jgi:hypothetical protein
VRDGELPRFLELFTQEAYEPLGLLDFVVQFLVLAAQFAPVGR